MCDLGHIAALSFHTVLLPALALTFQLASAVPAAQPQPDSVPAGPVAASLRVYTNSGLPSLPDDGPVWAGRGTTVAAAASWSWNNRFVTLRVAPLLWAAQNLPVSLIPQVGTPGSPYGDALRPRRIDLPQRFGDQSLARLEPGESELTVRALGVRASLTSVARRIGLGEYHAIIMSPTAPGFPRVELGTNQPWRTPIGDFAGTLAAGRLPQTPWAPDQRVGVRSGSFLEGRWRPLKDPRLEFGFSRFYHQDWQGLRVQDLAIPFGSLFFDEQLFGNGLPDNQLGSVFGAARFPRLGLEVWGEFAKDDRSLDSRDLLVELEHASSWLVGLKRSWRSDDGAAWEAHATAASAKLPPTVRFRPPLATFYDHNILTQGHTNRGQLLGTYLLERRGGAELRLVRRTPRQTVSLLAVTRDLGQTLDLAVPEPRVRQEWSLFADVEQRGSGPWTFFTRAGLVADLNRHPTFGDAYNVVLATGLSWRP